MTRVNQFFLLISSFVVFIGEVSVAALPTPVSATNNPRITRVKFDQELPFVSGRIDIRDLKYGSIAREQIVGKPMAFACGGRSADPSVMEMQRNSAYLIQRDIGHGDSLRYNFEFALIRCSR